MKLIYTGKVTSKGLHIINRKQFDTELLQFMDKDVIITVERKKKRRSNPQNSYYWAVVVPMITQGLNECGYKVDKEMAHEFLKDKFNRVAISNEDTGEIIGYQTTTTKLTTTGMMDYFAEIQQFAAEMLNTNIPDPNEQLKAWN